MNILITGGAGFIGSHLTERLLSEGKSVRVLDDLSTGSLDNLENVLGHHRFEFIPGDILDNALVRQLISRADFVIHFAAAVGVRRILQDTLTSLRVNVQGSENALRACADFGVPVLLASTSEIYGKNESDRLCEDSDSVIGPSSISRWSYATAKKMEEFVGIAYHASHQVPVIITRFFNIVGPRQSSRYGMVLPQFVRAAMSNQTIRVFGDGRQTRNFTYVGDCVEAVVRLMSTASAAGKIINIGGTEEISIHGLAELVKATLSSDSQIMTVPYDEAYPEGGYEDMRRRVPCLCRIQDLTGWSPTTSIEDVIRKTVLFEKHTSSSLVSIPPHVDASSNWELTCCAT